MASVRFLKNRLLQLDFAAQAEEGETLLSVAATHGVPVGSNCGGVCGCSTCHVYVVQGLDSLEEMSEKEADRLDLGFDVRVASRLACQARVGSEDLVIAVTEESLRAFLDEHPDARRQLEATGSVLQPRSAVPLVTLSVASDA
jgi:ferredoxin, 2Fe-2S